MSQPSKPDGTDPRILSPSEDEPEVTIAHGYSTGKTYHTIECPTVKRMDAPNTVPKSVAEWKGYDKCQRCAEQESNSERPATGDFDTTPEYAGLIGRVTPTTCVTIRALLCGSRTKDEVGEIIGMNGSTVGRHANGCDCDHAAREVSHTHGEGWTPDGDGQLPTAYGDRGRVRVTPTACARLRKALATTPVHAEHLASVYAIDRNSVRRHASDRCTHDHDTTPATWDADTRTWHAEGDE